jgi:fructokinase
VRKVPEVVCLGELLIDFMPREVGLPLIDTFTFRKAPGGAPANVAVGLARLGTSAGFIGKVGDDAFGRYLAQVLDHNGVDCSHLRSSTEARTALAFVSLLRDGERDFMFYRHPSADMLLRPEEIEEAYVASARAFHFGSITLISEPSRSATLRAVELAREHGLLISYDPNLRLSLWPDETSARRGMEMGLPFADVLKLSEEEASFLTGKDAPEAALSELRQQHGITLAVATLGREGCVYEAPTGAGAVKGFAVKTVDTTGAGDGFVAGMLAELLRLAPEVADVGKLKPEALKQVFTFANAVGALTTTRKGASPSLPTRSKLLRFLKQAGR